ncbi:hypothetical protein N7527_001935 [Penicillium freii]|nr:hypothetical protein N7527_001935 [Penicillium freii]
MLFWIEQRCGENFTHCRDQCRADAEVWRHAGQVSIRFHAALDCLCVIPCSVPVRKVLAMDHHPHERDDRKRFGNCWVCNESGFRSRSGHRMQAMPRDQDYGPGLSFGLLMDTAIASGIVPTADSRHLAED